MAAGRYDILIEKGAKFWLYFIYKAVIMPHLTPLKVGTPIDYDTYHQYQSSGLPINLTGYTARMMVREDHTSITPVLDLSTVNGKISLGGTSGTVEVNVPASETVAIPIEYGVWDLELIDTLGGVIRVLQGKVKISPEVTR